MYDQKFKACIEACDACIVVSSHCANACLHEEDVKMMVRCISLDMDCVGACALAVAAMARNSEHANVICDMCAAICKSCGDECAKHKMEHCQKCAAACHLCAAECRKMSATLKAH